MKWPEDLTPEQFFDAVDELARVLCALDMFHPLPAGSPCQACTMKAQAAVRAGWRKSA